MNFFALSGLLIGIFNTAVAFFVFWKGQQKVHRLWAMFCVVAAIWGWGGYLIANTDNIQTADFLWRVTHIGIIFIPVFFIHFIINFLKLKRKWLIRIIYILGFIFLITNFIDNLFIANMRWVFNQFYYDSPPGLFYIPFTFFFFGMVLYGYYELLKAYVKSTGLQKYQIKYFLIATIVGFSGGGLSFLPVYKIDFYPIFNFTVFLYPVIMSYAIIRYRFLDIRLAFRRSFLKIILAAFAYGAFYGVSWLFIKTFGSVWAKPALISGIFIAILFAVMWPLVEKLTLKFSNKYVYASIYTIQDTISNLTRQLTAIVNLNKIAASISNAMLQVMNIEKVAILVKEINKNNFKIQQIIGFNEKKILNINQKSVSSWLNEHKSALVQGEIVLQAEDNPKAKEYGHLCRIAGVMKKLNIELCLPLIVRDNLIGFILLGEKKSADAYTAEDIKLLETLSNQASVAIENALLYDNMEEIIAGQTADLRNKNQHLEKLLKMRSEFLDIASHQLRTPISVIKGNLSMFLEGDFDKNPSAQKTALQSMFEKTEKLNSIINDILIASEVDTDNLNLSPLAQTEDVGQIAAKSIKFLQDRITAKKINFTFAPPREKLPVKSYERYLSIVIDNLIDNAITYTPNGGSVNIVLTKEKETNGQEIIKFAVTDTGIGVPQADQKKLFDKFRRAGNANNMKTDGTGIGLFIVKKLVKAHQGGQIGFASQENKGSTFWFSLPVYGQGS